MRLPNRNALLFILLTPIGILHFLLYLSGSAYWQGTTLVYVVVMSGFGSCLLVVAWAGVVGACNKQVKEAISFKWKMEEER